MASLHMIFWSLASAAFLLNGWWEQECLQLPSPHCLGNNVAFICRHSLQVSRSFLVDKLSPKLVLSCVEGVVCNFTDCLRKPFGGRVSLAPKILSTSSDPSDRRGSLSYHCLLTHCALTAFPAMSFCPDYLELMSRSRQYRC